MPVECRLAGHAALLQMNRTTSHFLSRVFARRCKYAVNTLLPFTRYLAVIHADTHAVSWLFFWGYKSSMIIKSVGCKKQGCVFPCIKAQGGKMPHRFPLRSRHPGRVGSRPFQSVADSVYQRHFSHFCAGKEGGTVNLVLKKKSCRRVAEATTYWGLAGTNPNYWI